MIGRTISHYEILEKLGEGGMGVVHKAFDTHLDRLVAIKVLPLGKVADADRKRRFVQEAKAASAEPTRSCAASIMAPHGLPAVERGRLLICDCNCTGFHGTNTG
jgi:serine/threonine protein kinase